MTKDDIFMTFLWHSNDKSMSLDFSLPVFQLIVFYYINIFMTDSVINHNILILIGFC
jgi:hypothetical protein